MKKKIIFILALVAIACLFTLVISATPEKPDLGVDFGEVQEISGFTPPSQRFVDTDERVVLFDGENYITYPTYYIMQDVTSFNDSFDFSALKEATQKDFDLNSIILLEIPEGITALAGWAVYDCKSCIYVKVPSTVVTYSNDAFAETPWLEVVECEDGSTPITMGERMFYKCSGLKYVKLPNNLVTMGKIAFSWCESLETLILGTSFEKFASSNNNFNGTANGKSQIINIYISTAFGSTGLNDTMFTYNSTATKDENAKMVFHYTGTRAEAEGLQSLAQGTSNNGKIAYATILSKDELATTTLDSNKNYIVYGYNKCEAFYGGVHNWGDVENSFVGEAYVTDFISAATCSNCNLNDTVSTICGPLFVNLGYSKADDGSAFTYGITLNEANIKAYEAATGKTLTYGFIVGKAGTEAVSGEIVSVIGESLIANSIITNFTQIQYEELNVYRIKMTKIETEAQKALPIYCNMYITDGEKVFYLGSVDSASKPTAITLNNLPTNQ